MLKALTIVGATLNAAVITFAGATTAQAAAPAPAPATVHTTPGRTAHMTDDGWKDPGAGS